MCVYVLRLKNCLGSVLSDPLHLTLNLPSNMFVKSSHPGNKYKPQRKTKRSSSMEQPFMGEVTTALPLRSRGITAWQNASANWGGVVATGHCNLHRYRLDLPTLVANSMDRNGTAAWPKANLNTGFKTARRRPRYEEETASRSPTKCVVRELHASFGVLDRLSFEEDIVRNETERVLFVVCKPSRRMARHRTGCLVYSISTIEVGFYWHSWCQHLHWFIRSPHHLTVYGNLGEELDERCERQF